MQWHICKRFPDYEVTRSGKVRRRTPQKGTRVGKVLRGKACNGYLAIQINTGNRRQTIKVHRLIAEQFIPNPDAKPTVNHKNGDRHDNRDTNLEWATLSEQQRHAYAKGLQKSRRGSANQNARLNEADAKNVRELRAKGISREQVASIFGISTTHVTRICKGESW